MERQKYITDFVESVNRLSGSCGGDLGWDLAHGMLTIVDQGLDTAILEAKYRLNGRKNLTGLCLGSGGMFPLISEIPFTAFFLVDKNAAVVNFNHLLGVLLASEIEDPLLSLLTRSSQPGQDQEVFINEMKAEHMANTLKLILNQDLSRFGALHWSRPERRQLIRDRLRQTGTGYLWVDISTEKFSQGLNDTFRRQGRTIDFLNLTNVHEYNWLNGQMAFLETWPISSDVVIIFSSHKYVGSGHYPRSEVLTTLNSYLQRVDEDGKITVP